MTVEDTKKADEEAARIAADLQKLDHAITKLTEDWSTTVRQPPGILKAQQVSVKHRALIPMLIDAVTVAYGSSRSGGSSTGAVVNEVAFQKIRDLSRDIAYSWRTLIPSSKAFLPTWKEKPDRLLAIWYLTFKLHMDAGTIAHEHLAAEAKRWESWFDLIDLMFDPPRTSTYTGKCPHCGEGWVILSEGNPDAERVDAVILNFATATATCRACGEVWKGPAEFKILATKYKARTEPEPETPTEPADTPTEPVA